LVSDKGALVMMCGKDEEPICRAHHYKMTLNDNKQDLRKSCVLPQIG